MSEWVRLSSWHVDGRLLELAAVVEVIRDGFLVSIRYVEDGYVKDIVMSHREAATGTGRTVDAAFKRAMDAADKILLGGRD